MPAISRYLIPRLAATTLALLAAGLVAACGGDGQKAAEDGAIELLNVSYDPTRELYTEVNAAFAKRYQAEKGRQVTVRQSHGGSGSQARAVIEGLPADVVTLALAGDIDTIRARTQNLLPENWQQRLPDNSCPYTSTIVFVVRKGNPQQIRDWDDLARQGVDVVTPNPKTSGGARWNYLAAWGFALRRELGGDFAPLKDPAATAQVQKAEAAALAFVGSIFNNVSVLDRGARASTTTFVQNKIGDVLIAWENEAQLALAESAGEGLEIVYPSLSILAEPPVAWLDRPADKAGTSKAEVAKAYLEFLFTDEGQEIVAKHYYRPSNGDVLERWQQRFPELAMFGIDEVFGGWKTAQARHFENGGTFDQIYQPTAQ
jgi:sulfate/thiosulfate-binding protein